MGWGWGLWGSLCVPGVVSGGWGTGLPGTVCSARVGPGVIPESPGAGSWRWAVSVAHVGSKGVRVSGGEPCSPLPTLTSPNKILINAQGGVMTAAFYSFFPLVPSLRWWWIFHPLTLRRRCTLATCGLPSLAKACAGCSNLQVMMC